MYKLIQLVSLVLFVLFNNQTQAVCQANNPNNNVVEDTPTNTFTDNGTTVMHHLTGLIWDKCTLGLSGAACTTGSTNFYNWQNALKEVIIRNNTNYLGFNDWRLPNIKELESIVENCGSNPSINQTIFPNTTVSSFLSSGYWSSSIFVANPSYAWHLIFYYGVTNADDKSENSGAVRLVRGGQLFENYPAGDINGDNLVNILDVIAVINIILSSDSAITSNCNSDGFINILDVICISNIILKN